MAATGLHSPAMPAVDPFDIRSVVNSEPPPSAYARLHPDRRRTVDRWLSGLPAAEAARGDAEPGVELSAIEGARDAITERRAQALEHAGLFRERILAALATIIASPPEGGPFATVRASDIVRACVAAMQIIEPPARAQSGPTVNVIVDRSCGGQVHITSARAVIEHDARADAVDDAPAEMI